MGCSSSKNCMVKFKNNLSNSEYSRNFHIFHIWRINNLFWETYFRTDTNGPYFKIYISYPYENTKCEFLYQIHLEPTMGRTIVIRGIGSFKEKFSHIVKIPSSILFNRPSWSCFNRMNFQAKIYVFFDKYGIRKWNFEREDIHFGAKRIKVQDGHLYVPIESIAKRAPLLAAGIDENELYEVKSGDLECFLQIHHGVQTQLDPDQFKSLLKLSVKYEVFNVKRYCEQQLIWRDDLGFTNLKKYKLARKFNLIHLMHNLLNDIKTIEELVRFARRKVDGMLVEANMAKLIIGRMYELK